MPVHRRVVLAAALGAAQAAGAMACFTPRGGEAIPIDRRVFSETKHDDALNVKERTDAAVDAEADAAPPPKKDKPPPPRDGGVAWRAPKDGYLEQLGSEYRRLRPLPMTEYEVNHSKGRKRQVMLELGRLLVHASRDTVLRIMGSPDSDVRSGSREWGPTARQDSRGVERMSYQWRLWKDYLIFELDAQGNVIRSEWVLSTQ